MNPLLKLNTVNKVALILSVLGGLCLAIPISVAVTYFPYSSTGNVFSTLILFTLFFFGVGLVLLGATIAGFVYIIKTMKND